MQVNKKQVKAILDILSKDDARPALMDMFVQDGYLYATDAFHLLRVPTELKNGKAISSRDLLKTYKLASSKDMIELDDLARVSTVDYPKNIKEMLPKDRLEKFSVALNSKYIDNLSRAIGDTGLKFTFTGSGLSPVLVTGESVYHSIDGLIMPIKI